MLFRNCAGGVVFCKNNVFIIQNDKNEWVLPKGIIKPGFLSHEVATARVLEEAGINGEILCTAGATSYEFYSISRQKPVCNEIKWYIMSAKNEDFAPNKEEGFIDGAFLPVDEAIKKITYSQDKSLVRVSFEKYKNYETN